MVLLGCLCLIGGNAMGQEVTVHDAVITIPEGTHFNTDGGITLQGDGGIDNQGVLELKGDWTNNGQGLLTASTGIVVMDGENQTIAGAQPSAFHNLVMQGQGEKNLAAHVTIAGALTLQNCAVITHGYAFLILNADPQKLHLENAVILAEKVESLGFASLQFAPAAPISWPASPKVTLAAAAAPSGPTSRLKIKRTSLQATVSAGQCAGCSQLSSGANALLDNPNESLSSGARAALLTMYHSGATIGEPSFFAFSQACVVLAQAGGCTSGWNASFGKTRMLNYGSACAFSVVNQHLTGIFYTA
jgi:hypothetical protein